MTIIQDRLLTTQEVAERLAIKPTTLVSWRSTRRGGPRWIRVGTCVRYRTLDVVEYIENNLHGGDDNADSS